MGRATLEVLSVMFNTRQTAAGTHLLQLQQVDGQKFREELCVYVSTPRQNAVSEKQTDVSLPRKTQDASENFTNGTQITATSTNTDS